MTEQSENSNYRAPTFAQATEAIEKLEEIKQALELGGGGGRGIRIRRNWRGAPPLAL